MTVFYQILLFFYRLLFPILFWLYYPFYLRHLKKRGNFEDGFSERFGRYTPEKAKRIQSLGQPIWIHAVSVGETVAALALIRRWHELQPNLTFVLSTTTSTGQELGRKAKCEWMEVLYFPLDGMRWVSRALDTIRPRLIGIFEVEIWPNFLHSAKSRNIPVVLINGRVSESSGKGYRRFAFFFRHVFANFSQICLQSSLDFERLGLITHYLPQIHICGNMKFDQIKDPQLVHPLPLIQTIFPSPSFILCGASTHAPEEQILIRIFQDLLPTFPDLRLLLVPRHHERRNEIEEYLKASALEYDLLTRIRQQPSRQRPLQILLGDTTGELLNLMASSDLVFMGKSLGDFGKDGGHNIIEPASLGKPVIFGPSMHNFAVIRDLFLNDEAAIQVHNPEELKATIEKLLLSPELRQEYGQRAYKLVQKHRGSIDKTIQILNHCLT